MERHARALTVASLSASTLAFEVLLVRVFAIESFHHFAYMAIGVAMLGLGASGTAIALARPDRRRSAQLFRWAALLTPAALIASAALVHQIHVDPTQLPWDLWAWPRLGLVYLLLAAPFAVAALAILLALVQERQRIGRLYGASFVGAGVGAVMAVAVLWMLTPQRALAVPACAAALGSVCAAVEAGRRHRLVAAGAVLLSAGVIIWPLWRLEITPYKGLPQVEAFPDARRVAERTSPLGWAVSVDAAAFRHAPGLSLAYRGTFPRQTALFVDGEIAGAVYRWEDESAGLDILDWLPSAAPYALGEYSDVLVLAAGGGTEVWNAMEHGSRRVVAVELNPQLVRLAGWLGETVGQAASMGPVAWAIGDARGYVARSDESFDLIAMGAGRAFGTSAAGVHALNEDFLHTVEAYVSYLRHLSDEGVLAITRWTTIPPRESVRVILTAAEALRRAGAQEIGRTLVVLRSWATTTVLVKPSGFAASELRALSEWANDRRFDIDWQPGATSAEARFNLVREPVTFEATAAAVDGPDSAARFTAGYPFEVGFVDDARPYPHHFLRAASVGEWMRRDRGSWLAFAEWGYVALLATLVQSVILAALLMLVPAAVGARARTSGGWLRLVGYFTAIGLAYLAAEIAAIQQVNLLLGHPVYAVAVVLAAVLVFSGLGSAWSDKRSASDAWAVSLLLAIVLAAYGVLLLGLVHLLQPTHLWVRAAAALTLLVPIAFLMGQPFALGLRSLTAGEPEGVAWGWAANGFASVVATPTAALIALEAGSRVLWLAAASAYGIAAVLHWSGRRATAPQV